MLVSFRGKVMQFKVHSKNQCPWCGRTDISQRVRRGRFVRWIWPDACLMQCRLCLTRYLVRQPQESQSQQH
jgi:hypothetical protein